MLKMFFNFKYEKDERQINQNQMRNDMGGDSGSEGNESGDESQDNYNDLPG